jgi:hypothetical protein
MVGALAGFRQQDAVHGLPLQLNAEEVTLAAQRGATQPPLLASCAARRRLTRAGRLRARCGTCGRCGNVRPAPQAGSGSRPRSHPSRRRALVG